MNTTHDTQPANVPLPAGASTDGWHLVDHDGVPVRSLEWSRYDTGKVGVSIDGSQRATGGYTRGISFYGVSEGQSMNAAAARGFAAALIEAADGLDKLDGPHAFDSTFHECCKGVGRHTPDC